MTNVPLLILDILFLQLDVLQVPLQLLQCGVLISPVRRNAFDGLDVGYGRRDGLVVRRHDASWILYRDVAHCSPVPLELVRLVRDSGCLGV